MLVYIVLGARLYIIYVYEYLEIFIKKMYQKIEYHRMN